MKPMAADKAKNKSMRGRSMHEAYVWAKRSSGGASSQHVRALRVPHGLMMGTQHRGARWDRARYAKDVRESMHGSDESTSIKKKCESSRTECGDPERGCQTHRDPEIQDVRPR
jgi:hypothetical protein